jgi:hypothetical protein
LVALATVASLLDRVPREWDEQQPDVLSRLRATVSVLRERFADPAVAAISEGALNNVNGWLQVIANELQSAVNQNNPSVMVANGQLVNNLEAISGNFGSLPVSQPVEALRELTEEAQRRLNTMQGIQLEHESLWRQTKDQAARLLADAQKAKDEGLKRLQEQEIAADRLLAALGAEGTSSGYRATADAEQKQADFWRWVTIVVGAVAAILGVVLFLKIHEQGPASVSTRIAVTLPVVLMTVYAGKQSAGHRLQERESRRLALSFGSVDAYLADLDPVKRAELKGILTSDLYRASAEKSPHTDGYPTSADLISLLNEAIKRLR